jgi:folate-binding Fe-S cluster repair protein YgfZ
MKAAFLADRGVVKVSGEDARKFLNGLVTTDLTRLHPGLGRFGALLTPQGKIIVDFLIGPWRRFPDRLSARAGAAAR